MQLRLFFAGLLTLVGALALGQTRLSGVVADSSGKPLPFASVALLNARDSSVAKGTASDQHGHYLFENIRTGRYVVRGTAVGYQKAWSAQFEVSNVPVNVPALTLTETAGQLNTVQVTAKKPFVEQQIDRMVVNVAGSIVGSGSTALEVLEKAPGVTVDYQNERVQLRGKDGVIVQIDGRQSYLSPQDVVALLRTMSSDNIATIELITNPGSRYDAAGNSGIINIRLKKNASLGTNGTVSAAGGSGRYDRERGSLQLNHRTAKLNLFGSYSLNRSGSYWDFLFNSTQADPTPPDAARPDAARRNTTQSSTFQANRDLGQNAKVGFDYAPSANTTLGVVWTGLWSDHTSDGPAYATFRRLPDAPAYRQTLTDKAEKTISQNQVVNVNVQQLFGEKGAKGQLTADLDYGQFSRDFTNNLLTQTLVSLETPAVLPRVLINTQPTTVAIRTAKTDYSRPLGGGWKLETGLKWASVSTDNDLHLSQGITDNVRPDPLLSNHFQYTERVTAAYAGLTGKLGGSKTEVQLGLRAEHTQSEGNSLTLNQVVARNYLNLFPSLFITRPLATGQLTVSYSYRIDRPNYQSLNPARSYVDPYTYRQGNAVLKPQYTQAIDLRYGLKSGFFVSLGANFTTDLVNSILYGTGGNTSYIIWQNAGNAQGYTLTTGWPATIAKGWQLQTTVLGYYNQFQLDYEGRALALANVAGRINANNAFTLSHGWTAELTGWVKTPAIQVLDHQPWLASMDVGVQKAMSAALKLKFTLQDVFHSAWIISYMDVPGTFSSDVRIRLDSRVALLNVSYTFGNQKVKASRQRKTGSEDESRRAN